MKKLFLAVMLSFTVCIGFPVDAAEKPQKPVKAKPVAAKAKAKKSSITSPEFADAVKALRAIEAKVDTGLNYRDYNNEVGQLNISLNALQETAEYYEEDNIVQRIKEIRKLYMLASDVWEICSSDKNVCNGEFIKMMSYFPYTVYAKQVIEMFPELDVSIKYGGAYGPTRWGSGDREAHRGILISRLWSEAETLGKQLRNLAR
jgi:hypothetical protein